MIKLALSLESLGYHRGADRLLLFALNGRKDYLDSPQLIPEQQRERDYLDNPPGVLQTMGREPAPLDLNLGRRLKSDFAPSGPEADLIPENYVTDGYMRVDPADLDFGFIAPDGRCYEIYENIHDDWAYEILKGKYGSALGSLELSEDIETTDYMYKAILQSSGWISFWRNSFNTFDGGETHAPVRMDELTSAQRSVVSEIYHGKNEYFQTRMRIDNPDLLQLFI